MKTMRWAISNPLLVLALMLLTTPPPLPAATNVPVKTPAARITTEIDESVRVTLHGNVAPMANARNDRGAAPDGLQLDRMMLLLSPGAAQRAALKHLLRAQQNPNSPEFHQWITPAQYGESYGVAQADIDRIAAWLESRGFIVESVSNARNLVVFSGTNSAVNEAFLTRIHRYSFNGKDHLANDSDPEIPAALAPVVAGIVSLNDLAPTPMHEGGGVFALDAKHGKWGRVSGPTAPSAPRSLLDVTDSSGEEYYVLGPSDFGAMYNVKPLWASGVDGTGQTIAVVSDSDINPVDVDMFRASFGLPGKKLNVIHAGPVAGIGDDEGEADLDVQWSGAVAPGATIDLVVGANTNASNGVDLASEYAVDNNLAPILSISYGACEYLLGNASNQFHESLHEQAAAQGMTVLVASGDWTAATCDSTGFPATYGFAVNGLASTSNNIAVGGTDLFGNFQGTAKHWSETTDPVTLQSLQSYVPENPWNNTCGNSTLLAIVPQLAAKGLIDPSDTTSEQICNDPIALAQIGTGLDSVFGGGGGPSNCATFDGTTYPNGCTGRPKPSWQSQVLGVLNDGVRDLPDVALFAGNGFWGSFYAYCESDQLPLAANGSCDPLHFIEGAGGTSFASPAFAGILALVNQKTNSQQGNANYILYKIAAEEFNDSNSLTSCNSASVGDGNACAFYDISQGSIAPACAAGYVDCVVERPTDPYGVLPGWNAAPGYDMASGLGSVNAANLVNNWASAVSALVPSTTVLSIQVSAVYGTPIAATLTVSSAKSNLGPPTGDGAVLVDTASSSGVPGYSPLTLSGGDAMGQVNGIPVGTHALYGHYGGDTLFAGSTSEAVTVTVTQAGTTSSLLASQSTVLYGQSVTLSDIVETSSTAEAPSGTVTFANQVDGSVVARAPVVSAVDLSTGASIGKAFVTIPASALGTGTNTFIASYSGDSNYGASSAAAITVSSPGPFTIVAAPDPLLVSAANPGASSALVTASPNGGYPLSPLTFSCASTVPGISCQFTAPAATAASVASTLTIQLSAPLSLTAAIAAENPAAKALPKTLLSGGILAAGLLLLSPFARRKRRWFSSSLVLLCLGGASLYTGCGSGSTHSAALPAVVGTTIALTTSSATPVWGSAVTLNAKIAQSQTGSAPTGAVTFMDGTATLGLAGVAAGAATFTVTLPLGGHTLTAIYSGDASNFTSTSAPHSVDVTLNTTLAVMVKDQSGNTSSTQLPVTIQ